MEIRRAGIKDYDGIWEIFKEVIKAGDTYVFAPETPKEELKKHWLADYMDTYVVSENGLIQGTYIIKPNHEGFGSHIANASYMVHPSHRKKGIGKLMCEHSLKEAKRIGFRAMQFNIVVSTNEPAIKLWKKYGFKIIGTIPEAFNHLSLGYVDAYIMYKKI